jgi:hypothetical protein
MRWSGVALHGRGLVFNASVMGADDAMAKNRRSLQNQKYEARAPSWCPALRLGVPPLRRMGYLGESLLPMSNLPPQVKTQERIADIQAATCCVPIYAHVTTHFV